MARPLNPEVENLDPGQLPPEAAIQLRFKRSMRSWRTRRGYSRKRMAEKLGVTETNYAKYESLTLEEKRSIPTWVMLEYCELANFDFHKLARDGKEVDRS